MGDYFYQKHRKESIDVDFLSNYVAYFLKCLENERPEAIMPKFIIILRDGISESQVQMVNNFKKFFFYIF